MHHIHGFLNTPPLWEKKQFGLQQFEMPEIKLATFTPKPIPTNLRLGHQVEHIFKQLVEYSGAYRVRAHNVQIKKGNTTIGELDFILEDIGYNSTSRDHNIRKEVLNKNFDSDRKQLLHIELTYKFYIIDPSISEPMHRLMGPNRKDMFFTKVEKTRDKQLPMLFSPEGKKALSLLDISTDGILQQTAFLGQLFVPYGLQYSLIWPLRTNCIQGFWMFFDSLNTSEFQKYVYYIPYKQEWLHEPHEDVLWKSHFETLMDINLRLINEQSPMVWIRKAEECLEKCFIVWWS